jgi:hypothetical protein
LLCSALLCSALLCLLCLPIPSCFASKAVIEKYLDVIRREEASLGSWDGTAAKRHLTQPRSSGLHTHTVQ